MPDSPPDSAPKAATRVEGGIDGGIDGGIEGVDLTMTFSGRDVVSNLDLCIEPGTVVGLIGPSGCGKTTTVRMLSGLLRPTHGAATIAGTPSTNLSARQRQRIGYLPQTPALFAELSLWENLSFHASVYGLPLRRRRHLRQLLEWVELDHERRKRVSEASGGMQRRLALAATFVHSPDFIFLDEPTAGIDPILREKFWQDFRAQRDAGRTLLVTTQYVGEASYCDYVGLLSDGELLMFDTPANLRRAAFEGEVIDLLLQRPADDREVARIADLPVVVGSIERPEPNSLRIVVDDASQALDSVRGAVEAMGITILDASEHVVDYDEAFVRVVERHRVSMAAASGSDGDGDDRLDDPKENGKETRQETKKEVKDETTPSPREPVAAGTSTEDGA